MSTETYQHSNYHLVDLRPAGLDIFKGDGSNWIKLFILRGCVSVDTNRESWIFCKLAKTS